MPRLRRLSGDDIVSILVRRGFFVHSQRGSHVELRRVTAKGTAEILTIPRHEELDVGTLHAIFLQACRFIPRSNLRPEFYTD